MSLKALVSPAGGLSYHLIAFKRARTLWAPFRAQVRGWLCAWRAQWSEEDELIVFGSSAGWTLPLEDFKSLKKITFVEPDPLARFILSKSFARTQDVRFVSRTTLLPWFTANGEASTLREFLSENPRAAILFSNVLGQIPLLLSATELSQREESARKAFLEAVQGRSWASYHDVYSSREAHAAHLSRANAADDLSASDWVQLAQDTFANAGAPVIDHDTQWLSEKRSTEFALWPVTTDQVHLIAFVKEVAHANLPQDKASR